MNRSRKFRNNFGWVEFNFKQSNQKEWWKKIWASRKLLNSTCPLLLLVVLEIL